MGVKVGGVLAALAVAVAALCAGAGLAQNAPAAGPATAPAAPTNGARLAPGQPIPAAELEAYVDGVVTEAMDRDHIAGAAVSVVQNGQVVFKKGYGVDRLGPTRAVDPDRTLFRLGPITQTFTWIGLMREIEAGRVRLDAPINLYLPLKDQVRDQGDKRQVLVSDLMSHTAGFEDRALGQLYERNPERIRPLDVYLHQERPRRVRAPGTLSTYSTYGAALAGEGLVQVTGKTAQALTERQITGPLGLARTTLREPYPQAQGLPAPMDPNLAGDLSQGFGWTGSGFRARPTEFVTQAAPAAAGSSTAADMGRYMLAILGDGTLEGATIYSPAIAQKFRTSLKRSAPGVRGWDHGFMEYELPAGVKGYGHDGSTLSFRANLVTAPTLGLGVFVAANTDTAGALTAELPARIVERFYGAPPALPPGPSTWLNDNASAFIGDYLTTARAYRGLESFASLLRADGAVKIVDGVLVTPGRDGARRWSPDPQASLDAPYVNFRELGGPQTLMFQMSNGRATRWFEPSGAVAFERSGPLSSPAVLAGLALATGLASAAAIAGLFLRDRREFRQTSVQGRADAAQLSAAILWLASLFCFWAWSNSAGEVERLMYGWPGAWLLIASACAFVASVMTLLCLGLLPVVWRGGRRLDSWTAGRKARFTLTTLIYALLSVMLGLWGALEPWSR